MKKIWIITLFPDLFNSFFELGVAGCAFTGKRGIDFEINILQMRDYAGNKYGSVDDYPYGGGAGMVIRPDVLERAILEGVVSPGNYGDNYRDQLEIIYPSAKGKKWSSKVARDFAGEYLVKDSKKDLVFICGRYEGIDERFIEQYVDRQFCIGDFILTGGELAVQIILDSAIRFAPEALGNKNSAEEESFSEGLLEFPQYTRPPIFNDAQIPDVLLSGNHGKIEKWRDEQKTMETKKYRPDLLEE